MPRLRRAEASAQVPECTFAELEEVGGRVGRCEMQTEQWFLGQMTDRSNGGDRAIEETSTAVQRAYTTHHSPPEGHSFIQQMLMEDLPSQALCCSVRKKIVDPISTV